MAFYILKLQDDLRMSKTTSSNPLPLIIEGGFTEVCSLRQMLHSQWRNLLLIYFPPSLYFLKKAKKKKKKKKREIETKKRISALQNESYIVFCGAVPVSYFLSFLN